jgi:hypothetical protein
MSRALAIAVAISTVTFCFMACETRTPTSPENTLVAAPSSDSSVVGGAPPAAKHSASHSHNTAALSADANQQIAQLRRLLAPFHNFDKAVEFGYSVPVPGPGVCISDPVRGGMGYHYTLVNEDLVTDGVVNIFEPEFIVYSPMPNGRVRLSAVDYFVPYNTWPHAEPPSLLGVPFQREDAFQAYVLHIWAFWHNPAGIFENYNPDVPQCPQ